MHKVEKIRVAVLHNSDDDEHEQIRRVASEFDEDGKIEANAVSLEAFQKDPAGYHVVYFDENIADSKAVRQIATKQKLLSITSSKDFVSNGTATLAVFFDDGKVSIFINDTSAKLEGKSFFGEILALAEVLY
ncbi:YfiR/HmsC family protein [Chloroherpeton thalassium]|uniref:YfiR/HmsC family protein n=1 Tax=Chloroherpeton thalassium TaxID=100716 RepID=UPI00145CD76B|nr:YfiR/HmsC family protein [Chloroherpeton thalassium]